MECHLVCVGRASLSVRLCLGCRKRRNPRGKGLEYEGSLLEATFTTPPQKKKKKNSVLSAVRIFYM